MKAELDCYVCTLRQSLEAARFTGASEEIQRKVIQRTLTILQNTEPNCSSAEMSLHIHQAVKEETGFEDPYQVKKEQSTQEALRIYPDIKSMVEQSADPFSTAVKVAVAGNIIDFGVNQNHNLADTIRSGLSNPLAEDAVSELRNEIENAEWILFIGDNAGETVCDRILIEEIEKITSAPIKYAVRSGAVLNDTTLKDAIEAGLDQVAEIVTTGHASAGVLVNENNKEFQSLLNSAPVVIAKGQGNFEGLNEFGKRFFFLLQIKCPVLSSYTGLNLGSWVVKRG